MKSPQDIYNEYFDQRHKEDSKNTAKAHEARAELDALFQRAGIRDTPDDVSGDDADKWRDEGYYRRRVREMVGRVRDVDLRRQIMRQLSIYRCEVYDRWNMLCVFDEQFAS